MLNEATQFGSSARERLIPLNVNDMKKNDTEELDDDLRSQYDFDYSKMKPNRFAGEPKVFKKTFITLDEDVSKVFQSSEAVNAVLRSAIKAMRTAASEATEKR